MKKYKIQNLDCANCALKIETAINQLQEVRTCSINFATSSMALETSDLERVKATIKNLEPEVRISAYSTGEDNNTEKKQQKKDFLTLLLSGVLFLGALLAAGYLQGSPWMYIIYLPAYLLSGRKVLFKAGRNILKGRIFDENFLMSLATLGAFAIGQPAEAVGVMFFFQIGEYIQNLSLRRSRKSIRSLLELQPEYATVKTPDGLKQIKPEQVTPGSILLIKPGDRVPLDGKILQGSSQVDTSALSGESLPRYLKEKDPILAGMINKTHALEVQVTKSYNESSIARILDLVENAATKKAKTEKFITRFARYYTPVVVIAALAVAVFSPLLVPSLSFSEAVHRAFVLLVISCPCALVLSIPLGYFVGISNASREGILIKGSIFLDLLAKVKTVIFDKTGTLTEGRFKVQRIVPVSGHCRQEVLDYAALVESHSNHPIAASIGALYKQKIPEVRFDRYEEIGGSGIIAEVEGKTIIAGNDKLMHMENVNHEDCFSDGTVLHISLDREHLGYIIIADEIKKGAPKAISCLKELGVNNTVMLTGDNAVSANHVAEKLQIDHWYANLLPGDKIAHLEKLAADSKNRPIAFIGDGINDSPIIAQADIGIAMGKNGSDAAIDVADIVLLADSPDRIPEAIRIAKGTRAVVWQNILFAIGIKLLFIVLGIAGLAGMWGAVFADIGVSLLAVLNAIRMHRSRGKLD